MDPSSQRRRVYIGQDPTEVTESVRYLAEEKASVIIVWGQTMYESYIQHCEQNGNGVHRTRTRWPERSRRPLTCGDSPNPTLRHVRRSVRLPIISVSLFSGVVPFCTVLHCSPLSLSPIVFLLPTFSHFLSRRSISVSSRFLCTVHLFSIYSVTGSARSLSQVTFSSYPSSLPTVLYRPLDLIMFSRSIYPHSS